MKEQWGSVEGDANASAIMMDRHEASKVPVWLDLVLVAALIGTAIWYAVSPSPAVLATLIVLATFKVGSAVSLELFQTHTFLMIAERRIQLVEQQVQSLETDLHIGHLVVTAHRERELRRTD